MSPEACLRTAVPLVLVVAALSCGGGTQRPDAPSPPPIHTESAAEAPGPARAVETAAPPADEIRPVPAAERVDAATVEPATVARTKAATPAVSQPALPDPLRWMEDRKAREEAGRVRLASAEKAVDDAKVRVSELESRLLAVKNPFLPRPALSQEEAAAWEGLDGAGRARRVEEQLVEARAELDRAEATLAAIRSR